MLPSHWVAETATKWTKTQFGHAHFIRKPAWIHPQIEGGGGALMCGGGGRLCEILAKWGVGVYPDRGVNPRGYGITLEFSCIWRTRNKLFFNVIYNL